MLPVVARHREPSLHSPPPPPPATVIGGHRSSMTWRFYCILYPLLKLYRFGKPLRNHKGQAIINTNQKSDRSSPVLSV
jgi:hypothetical protein